MNTTTETTTAQKISALLRDDGQVWHDADGRHLDEIAEAEKGRKGYRDGWGTDTYRWNFPDGSALVVAGDAWDFALEPESEDCFCWKGTRRHDPSCPTGGAL